MSMAVIATFAAIVMFVLLSTRKKKEKDKPPQSGWQIRFSPGMPNKPTPQGQGFYFDFPTNPGAHVHYVQRFDPPRLQAGAVLIARFRVTGGAFVPQEFPTQPATVSLIIQRKGDDWSAVGKMASYRWYSGVMTELVAGEHTLSVPIDVQSFGDVYGGHDAAAFAEALANVESIGLVFGSAGGRGHGVYAQTPSRFELISMVQN